MKNKIIVTGANGQLGQELRVAASAIIAASAPAKTSSLASSASTIDSVSSSSGSSFDFVFLTRNELPLDDLRSIRALFETHQPKYCINCAAYTAVDKAESDKETAFRVNGDAVGDLAAICKEYNTRLIHISTDYVFDGTSAIPLKETDPTGPVNIYGASKLKGEQLAMQAHPDGTVILRTSWVYSGFGNNFVKTMIRLMGDKEFIRVVDDQIGSPTYAADLAAVILQIISAPTFIPGIYHYSNEGEISWHEFALAIKEMTGSPCRVDPLPTAQYPTPARRPHYSLLDKALIKKTFGVEIPDWKDSLARCLSLILSNKHIHNPNI
jgi:dTDP-4-dehydrorhamnose reductase